MTAHEHFVALLNRPAWHEHAACRGDATWSGFGQNRHQFARARRTCATCPVALDCALWAITWPREPLAGIWGGLDARERDELRGGGVAAQLEQVGRVALDSERRGDARA